MGLLRVLVLLTVACHLVAAFVAQPPLVRRAVVHNREAAPIVCAEPTPEEVTKKWGFEAGMFSALKGAGKGEYDIQCNFHEWVLKESLNICSKQLYCHGQQNYAKDFAYDVNSLFS